MAVGSAYPPETVTSDSADVALYSQDHCRQRTSTMKTVGSTVGTNDVYYMAVKSSDTQSTVNVNSLLIWWGLRGSHYGSTSCPGVLSLYQKLILAFLSLMLIRWILIMFLPLYVSDSAGIMFMLGEMDRHSSTKAGRMFHRSLTLVLALMSLLMTIFCYRHRKDKRVFAWLKLFELMKNSLKPSDLKMTEYMGMIVWRNTAKRLTISRWLQAGYLLSLTGVIVYGNMDQIMSGNLTVITWSVIHGLWMFLMGVHVMGLIALFLSVVFYFNTRMNKLINDLRLMNEKDKTLPQLDRAEILYAWLIEFDLFHTELEGYTLFWQNFILVFFLIGYLLLFFQLTCFTRFYPYFTWTEWALVGICGLVCLTIWVYAFLKAAAIAENAKDLYRVMNRFCLIPTHDFVQVKMNNFVKKFSSIDRHIGFHSYHMFYLSNEFLYHIAFHSGSCFILFIDSMISVAYKHLK